MYSFNLLNKSDIREVRNIKYYYLLKNISQKVLSVLIIFVLALFLNQLLTKNYEKSINLQTENELNNLKKEKISSIEDATDHLNLQLNKAKLIQSNYITWSSILGKFSLLKPQNINFSFIDFNTTSNTFLFSGVAGNREALIQFQENLMNSELFTDVLTPISSLIQKENIEFEISGKITVAIYD